MTYDDGWIVDTAICDYPAFKVYDTWRGEILEGEFQSPIYEAVSSVDAADTSNFVARLLVGGGS